MRIPGWRLHAVTREPKYPLMSDLIVNPALSSRFRTGFQSGRRTAVAKARRVPVAPARPLLHAYKKYIT